MNRFQIFLPLLLVTAAVAQSSSGDDQWTSSARSDLASASGQEEMKISRRSADFEGSASGEETFRTLECACVIVEKIEAFEEDNNETASADQEEDAYRRRRNADETEGSGSGEDKKGPFAFVHQAGTRSDDRSSVGFVTVHRIVLCKCADDSDEEASGSGDESSEETFISGSGTESSGKDKPQTTASNDGQEESEIYRRSALDTQEASGEEEEGLPTISTASTPEVSTLSTLELSTVSLSTRIPRARRSIESSGAEEQSESGESSGAQEVTVATISTASTPELSTVEITTASTPELPTISTPEMRTLSTRRVSTISPATLATPATLPTLATISPATLPTPARPVTLAPITPVSIITLAPITAAPVVTAAPITRAQRHAEGSGLMDEN